MSRLAQRYAKAIFGVAQASSSVDAVGADLERLSESLGDPAISAQVLSPVTKSDVRAKIIERLLGDCDELTTKAVGVVLQRRRESILAELAPAFGALLRESRGEVLGVIETAKPLEEADFQVLKARASKLVGKAASLTVNINPDLIGGVRIRIGNTLYDGSVVSVIEDLERALLDVPL